MSCNEAKNIGVDMSFNSEFSAYQAGVKGQFYIIIFIHKPKFFKW